MLLLAIVRRVRVVQIPVNYLPRVGESSVTGDFGKTLRLGSQMIRMVVARAGAQPRPATEVVPVDAVDEGLS